MLIDIIKERHNTQLLFRNRNNIISENSRRQMNMKKKRFISLLLSFALILTGLGAFTPDTFIKADVTPASTVVIACSDFQHKQGNAEGQELVRTLFDSVGRAGYENAQGFLCCGDYDYEYTEAEQGVTALRDVVDEYYGNELDIVMAQGNHDNVPIGTAGISSSGNNDTDNYGVFVINEDDYMWYNNDEARIKQTAENLKKYLYGKRKAKYTKPIFIVSHLALHYSMRTRNDGDGQYANYIFDEINDAGANGLNIIFLFGHNHSHGWDDYLGGAAIYQEKGEEILIANGSRENYTRETLEFTYMNAGYIGYYYGNENERNDGADDTLSMTVFEIKEDKVIVSRIDENGYYKLKSGGVSNESENHRETELGGYSPYTNIVMSPAEIALNKVVIQPEQAVTGKEYEKVKDVADISDGDKILMLYNGSFMVPEVKTADAGSGTRVGFKPENAGGIAGDTVVGQFDETEWTYTVNNSGWLLGDGSKYARLTPTDNNGITATLEDTGSVFTIGGNEDAFTFQAESYCLNWNESRGLVNGYTENPAAFSLYRYTGRTSTVNPGEGEGIYGDCEHPRSHIIDKVEAVCTDKGYTGDKVCTNCGAILEAGKETAALNHDWDGGTITTIATADAEGVKTYTCKRCNNIKTEAIPKLTVYEEPAKQDNLKPEVKAVAISSVKNNAKKTVTVKWKKSAKAKGYQIWYSTKKNFKGKKVINIKKGKTVKVQVKKLKKKTYYFKIRVLEKINGKKIYSLWSKVKKVKVKK